MTVADLETEIAELTEKVETLLPLIDKVAQLEQALAGGGGSENQAPGSPGVHHADLKEFADKFFMFGPSRAPAPEQQNPPQQQPQQQNPAPR